MQRIEFYRVDSIVPRNFDANGSPCEEPSHGGTLGLKYWPEHEADYVYVQTEFPIASFMRDRDGL